jgi:hypothetical protein
MLKSNVNMRQAASQQAESERQRAERLAAQLRQLGINPDETP